MQLLLMMHILYEHVLFIILNHIADYLCISKKNKNLT